MADYQINSDKSTDYEDGKVKRDSQGGTREEAGGDA